ncbi:hypothetical protein [Vreelandella titanicae]|uniref:hypothetical protein n=1 Tax=Vreelandella titanicae TaxID=664683 RepID=UPI003826A0FA
MERFNALLRLVEFSDPVEQLAQMLKVYSWDYDGEPLVLTASHVSSVLKRFLSDELSSEDLEGWANLIECREDIEFEEDSYNEIDNVINCLANPILQGDITPHSCVKLLATLE